MPILKVPIVHKFGIISQSQRLELQQRLLRQAYDEAKSSELPSQSHKNPLELSEQFVQKYNTAGFQAKQKLHEKAEKMLQRSKRRCGLLTFGEGDHVDLPVGWSELTILAQCKGMLQEDCLQALCTSLNHAPLHHNNIPTLFFLAESSLYWLRTDALKQPYLRSPEIKLLKVGQLVFSRLLYHHLSGHLRGLAEFKTRLHVYLDGMKEQQALYEAYPGIWLSLHFMIRVGEIVIGPYGAAAKSSMTQKEETRITESAPGLAACVHRALCVWRCAAKNKVGLKNSIIAMFLASHELKGTDWVNGYLAISLLGEAAKLNLTVCKALQDLARGVQANVAADGVVRTAINHFPSVPVETPRTENSSAIENSFQTQIDDLLADFDGVIKPSSDPDKSRQQNTRKVKSSFVKTPRIRADDKPASRSQGRSQTNTIMLAGIGSWCWETTYQYARVLADACLNGSSSEIQKTALLGKWQDADVTTFRAGAANPCIESCGIVDLLEYRGPPVTTDLATHAKSFGWTWKARYAALTGLCQLIHSLHGNKEKDGMRSAAWSLITALQECPATEDRILEAIKVSRVGTSSHKSPKERNICVWSRIAQGLCDAYIVSPLPERKSVHSRSAMTTPRSRQEQRTTPTPRAMSSSEAKRTMQRPTIREDILVHTTPKRTMPDFNTRTIWDLHRVVADQWRKERTRTQQEEEEEMMVELENKRIESEKQEEDMITRRKQKLKGRVTADLGPYELKL